MNFFVFNSEKEAEKFCTNGCPIIGKSLDGSEVEGKGVTTRLAEWVKHPTEDLWLVKASSMPEGTDGLIEELDEEKLFPKIIRPDGLTKI